MVKLVNRAKMSTATTGTGTITLGSAELGFQTFADAGVADADVVRYVIEDGNNWEIGTGTYTASGTTLTRTVQESSNADTAINLTGNAVVFVTAAAADLQNLVAYYEQTSEPSNPPSGALWFNPNTDVMSIYADGVWGTLTYTPPPPPVWYGDRGTFGGGFTSVGQTNVIDYITIATTGNAIDFGDLTVARTELAACSDGARGVFGGGQVVGEGGGSLNTLDYITIATTGNATDFGDLTLAGYGLAACSDGLRGLFGGGYDATYTNVIGYITIATTGNATDFGDLSSIRTSLAACSDSTRGVFGGGYNWFFSITNILEYVTIATTGNATDFGDLTLSRANLAACSSTTRGVFGGGNNVSDVYYNNIDYITIATTGNATDFGDLTVTRGRGVSACSDGSRGVFGPGYEGSYVNTIDYITIATTGNATDFGDATVARYGYGACSGS